MFWYPGASQEGGGDGVLLQIRPAGTKAWFGLFANGGVYPSGEHVLALPDRKSFAVVCDSASYRVNAQDPHDWCEISTVIVAPPLVLAHLDLVLFVDFTGIVAWGPNGLAWDTGGLVYDDMTIISYSGDVLTVEGSSPPLNTRRFHVNLRTGASHDGPRDGVSIPLPQPGKTPANVPGYQDGAHLLGNMGVAPKAGTSE